MLRYLVDVSSRPRRFAGVACALVAGYVLSAVAGGSPVDDAESSAPPSAPSPPEYSTEELRAWGISANCIESHRIRHIRFRDDESAIIQVTGGKRVLMTLERRCPGIRSRGFLHQTRINRLCTSDSLRVIDTGSICMIRDFTPYSEDSDPEDRKSAPDPEVRTDEGATSAEARFDSE